MFFLDGYLIVLLFCGLGLCGYFGCFKFYFNRGLGGIWDRYRMLLFLFRGFCYCFTSGVWERYNRVEGY